MTEVKPGEELSAGCETWIVPSLEHSPWAQKIDWYLNFQIRRSTLYGFAHKPEGLRQVLKDWEVELDPSDLELDQPTQSAAQKQLLIASAHLLPNRQTVMLTFEGDLGDWLARAKVVSQKLKPNPKSNRTRIFLPSNHPSSAPESAKVLRTLLQQKWSDKTAAGESLLESLEVVGIEN